MGAGIGFAGVSAEDLAAAGVSVSSYDDTVFAYQFGVGVGYAVEESVTLDFGYRYFATSDPEFNGAEFEFESHNISFGVRIIF